MSGDGEGLILVVDDDVDIARFIEMNLRLLVEIDGGINADTIEAAAEAGVDCFVAGSAVYAADDPGRAVALLRDRVRAATPHRWTA